MSLSVCATTIEYDPGPQAKGPFAVAFMNQIAKKMLPLEPFEPFKTVEAGEDFFGGLGLQFNVIVSNQNDTLQRQHEAMGQDPAFLGKETHLMAHGCPSVAIALSIMSRGVLANLAGVNRLGPGSYFAYRLEESLRYTGEQDYPPSAVIVLCSVHVGVNHDGEFHRGHNKEEFTGHLVHADKSTRPEYLCVKHSTQALPEGFCEIVSIGSEKLTAGMIERRRRLFKNHSFEMENQAWLAARGTAALDVAATQAIVVVPKHETRMSLKNVVFKAGDSVLVTDRGVMGYPGVLSPDAQKNGATIAVLLCVNGHYYGVVRMTDAATDAAVRAVPRHLLQTSTWSQGANELVVQLDLLTPAVMEPAGAAGAALMEPAGAPQSKRRKGPTTFYCISCPGGAERQCDKPMGRCCEMCYLSSGRGHDASCEQEAGAARAGAGGAART